MYSLGRLHSIDPQDHQYTIENLLALAEKPQLPYRYWWPGGAWGDQTDRPWCVAFAWLHWMEDGPVTHRPSRPGFIYRPRDIYALAQIADEWPGTDYDGTSVRAGAKVMKAKGIIKEYRWGWRLRDLINAVWTVGPAVVGTNWFEGMFEPDEDGLIHVQGRIAGGHAYVVNGVHTRKGLFRIKNSWGREWGHRGHAFITFKDMKRLIEQDGEICLAIEQRQERYRS